MNIKSRIKIYIIFGIISIIMVILAAILSNYNIAFNILNGLGCSTFSAILLAVVIDLKDYFNKKDEIKQKRKEYFEDINKEINFLIEKILWYDVLISEKAPVLNKSVEEQNSINFMLYTSETYKDKTSNISYEEAKIKLKKCEKKYSLEAISKLSIDERKIINKVFSVISKNSLYLIKEVNKIEQNKATLDSLNYITIKQIEKLKNNIFMFYEITSANDKNFGVAIKLLIICSDLVRDIGKYNNKIDIAPSTKGPLKIL